MDCFYPTLKIYDIDIYCDGCGRKIKAGCMVVYFPTREPGHKFFCCKYECGGNQLEIFVFDIDSPSFT